MEKIVLASNNKHKVKEFKEILTDYDILTLNEIEFYEEIEETGITFEENALIKAKTIHEFLENQGLNYVVIADDSGLCVDSIGGKPGVYSARYAGEHGNNEANRAKLQLELEGKDRSAYFICTIVVYFPNGSYKVFEGKTYGEISKEELGNKDFGYDCIFYSNDLKKTFGQATEDEKNSVSHRGRAIKKMEKELKK
ncbi:MAG: RdgB/HAM1 family non-canonical purine NTP pyrophosphatase [Clostridia bacterium]|nr:RdgB/HAM1 family non-canonical purine NTP pyrophosphatase [Clostridia bacterium]